jgi:hypothetical protein
MTDIIILRKDYAEFIASSSTIHIDLHKLLKSDYNGRYKIHIIEDYLSNSDTFDDPLYDNFKILLDFELH